MPASTFLARIALGLLVASCGTGGGEQLTGGPTATAGAHLPQGFACPPAGAVLAMDDGTELRFLGAVPDDPEVCRFASSAGPPGAPPTAALYGIWNAASDSAAKARAALRELFPLAAGKSARFTVLGEVAGAWDNVFTVKERRTLAVPAGRFDVWVIEYEQDGRIASHFVGREFLSLADNGMIIRREGTVVQGAVPAGSRFAAPPSQAVSIRMP